MAHNGDNTFEISLPQTPINTANTSVPKLSNMHSFWKHQEKKVAQCYIFSQDVNTNIANYVAVAQLNLSVREHPTKAKQASMCRSSFMPHTSCITHPALAAPAPYIQCQAESAHYLLWGEVNQLKALTICLLGERKQLPAGRNRSAAWIRASSLMTPPPLPPKAQLFIFQFL